MELLGLPWWFSGSDSQHFQGRGLGFYPWSWNEDPTWRWEWLEEIKKEMGLLPTMLQTISSFIYEDFFEKLTVFMSFLVVLEYYNYSMRFGIVGGRAFNIKWNITAQQHFNWTSGTDCMALIITPLQQWPGDDLYCLLRDELLFPNLRSVASCW